MNDTLIIGSHVSYKKDSQILGSLEEALSYNETTFMFYTGAPQNTARSPINEELVQKTKEKMKENNLDYSKVIVHAPYIINLANNTSEEKYNFSINFLKEEVSRCEKLGIKYMVLHPGSHVGLGVDVGIKNIIDGLNQILVDTSVTILLETMAGKGSEIGVNFQEIKKIITGVKSKKNIGVCLDTCHMNDSGVDISKFNEFLDEFDSKIGISKIKCVHINDSMNPVSSHKDRHANIGYGTIGFNNLINVVYNSRLEGIPMILETPYINRNETNAYAPYKMEIESIRNKEFIDFINK